MKIFLELDRNQSGKSNMDQRISKYSVRKGLEHMGYEIKDARVVDALLDETMVGQGLGEKEDHDDLVNYLQVPYTNRGGVGCGRRRGRGERQSGGSLNARGEAI